MATQGAFWLTFSKTTFDLCLACVKHLNRQIERTAILDAFKTRKEINTVFLSNINLYQSMIDKEGTDGAQDIMKASKAAQEEPDNSADEHVGEVSSEHTNRVDALLQKLEKEIDDSDAKIGGWRVLDRDYDGKDTPEEVAFAAIYLKDTLGKEDKVGKILVEDIVKLRSRAEDD